MVDHHMMADNLYLFIFIFLFEFCETTHQNIIIHYFCKKVSYVLGQWQKGGWGVK